MESERDSGLNITFHVIQYFTPWLNQGTMEETNPAVLILILKQVEGCTEKSIHIPTLLMLWYLCL